MTKGPTTVYQESLQHGEWTVHVATTNKGLCCITLPNEPFDTLRQCVSNHVPGSISDHDKIKMDPHLEQIEDYLSARRQFFSVPLDLRETPPFQLTVWRALLEIPFGEAKSYSPIGSSNRESQRCQGCRSGKTGLIRSLLSSHTTG